MFRSSNSRQKFGNNTRDSRGGSNRSSDGGNRSNGGRSHSDGNRNRNFRSNSDGGNRNFSGGRGGRGRQQSSFNPTMIIQAAAASLQINPVVKQEYVSKNNFVDFDICEPLKQNIVSRGYITPTPIQDQIINHILDNRDVVGLASTGTGKTAAFLIPLINNIFKTIEDKTQKLGRVLIMAPTRELALQINAEFKMFAEGMGIYSSLCIGGANMSSQISSLRRQPHFIIGTPGRLIDLEKRGIFSLDTFSAIVLDEVDQMFDMGFINDIKYVIQNLPEKRHSLFFSATLPVKMNDVVNSFLYNPIKVEIEKQKASVNVNQDIIKIQGRSKIDVLHELLDKDGFDKVLVFGRTKHGLNKLSEKLVERGVKVAAIHGNKSQSQRQRALSQFKNDAIQVLLATDIASRGLDIDNVTHVINFDLPQTYEDYIHRIGRTGRANKTGVALSFID
ncbi:DEAD/DEAH box helicase [Candidatus Woesebacteria bacterium]|nr:DEAD/DEAH box helicase [Candidatus Woesebacteria bacterium]